MLNTRERRKRTLGVVLPHLPCEIFRASFTRFLSISSRGLIQALHPTRSGPTWSTWTKWISRAFRPSFTFETWGRRLGLAKTAQRQPSKHWARPHAHRLEAPPSEAPSVGFANLVNVAVQIDILNLVENVDSDEDKTIKDLIFERIILQQYDDPISQYSKKAITSHLNRLSLHPYTTKILDQVGCSQLIWPHTRRAQESHQHKVGDQQQTRN